MVQRYLLDTHVVLWYWTEPEQLSKNALDILLNDDAEIYISAASIWELATKHRKGKLGKASIILQNFAQLAHDSSFKTLSIHWQHAKLSGEYALKHADPFDRMLVAQAELEKLALISCDEAIHQFPISIIW